MSPNATLTAAYLAVSPGYGYGVGETVEDAKLDCRRNGGSLNRVAVYQLPEHSHSHRVDPDGIVRWEWDTPQAAFDNWNKTDEQMGFVVVYMRGVYLD